MYCDGANDMTTSPIELFHPVLLPEMEDAALSVLRSGNIASGPKVAEFERAFSKIVARKHLVATSDMTSAMTLALHLAGVKAGDEVATLAFSCLSSNAPIARLGARALWVDMDPVTLSMSVSDLANRLTVCVKAVAVYHVAGYPADIQAIAALCKERGIALIEDCNNAIGATTEGRPLGAHGDYSIYSLYPNRQVNGLDGGVLATPDAATATRASRLRRFGIDAGSFRDARGEINPLSDVGEIGWAASLGQINAAVALEQLGTLAARLERTSANAAKLASALQGLPGLQVVASTNGNTSAYWGFGVLVEQRDSLLARLKSRGIKASVLHQRTDSYSGFGTGPALLPGTAVVMGQFLALPCGWWIRDEDLQEIVGEVKAFLLQ
jgi:perosamine synthetase